jgi:NAD(P)-dependent dehydrogenase (short-subunit alcohol dehydrogenase family)
MESEFNESSREDHVDREVRKLSMVEGFVKAAAVELPRGVRINCVSPTSGRVGRLSRLFHRLHARAGRGSRARLSSSNLESDHGAHFETAQNRELISHQQRKEHSYVKQRKRNQDENQDK